MNNPRQYRTRAKLTQTELARLAGISLSYLKDWEAGRRTNLSVIKFRDWAYACHMNEEEVCDFMDALK